MPTIDLPQGSVHYRTTGPADSASAPVVFVHPFLMGGSLWAAVADHLAEHGIRSFAPDWPLGAHRTPLGPDADMSPRGVAQLIASFLDALDLNGVTLVGADTGGALCQFVLDSDSSRVRRVVFSNCDAFDSFPPFPFNVIFRMLRGRVRMKANLQPMRFRLFRHSPLGFGLLANELDPTLTKAWVSPCLETAEIRDEAVRFLNAVKPKELLDVSTRLSNFDGQVVVVWGTADRVFRPELGRRLQKAFHDAQLVEVPGAKTLLALDAPEALTMQIVRISRS